MRLVKIATKFYCYYDGGIHLKKNHHYYHQVQLQLFVGGNKYSWCDFCVFTSKGIEVERIWPDIEWCTNVLQNLIVTMMLICSLFINHHVYYSYICY